MSTRITPILTDFSVPTKIIGDVSFSLVPPTTNSDGIFTYISSDISIATIVGNRVTIVAAGSTTITANQSLTDSYEAGTISASFVVNKQITTISAFTIAPKPFGSGRFTIGFGPSSNRAGSIILTSSTPSVAIIEHQVNQGIWNITPFAIGNTTIIATQASTSIYETGTSSTNFNVYETIPYTYDNVRYVYNIGLGTADVTGRISSLPTSLTVLESFVINGTTYTVTHIGENAFNGWSNLTSTSLPPTIKTMGRGCIANCSSLTSFTIPPLVTTIEEHTFVSCTSLTSITIPPNVTSMVANFNGRHGGGSTGAFQNCPSLVDIVLQTYIGNFAEVFFRLNNPNMRVTFDYSGNIPSSGFGSYSFRQHLTTTDLLRYIVIGNQISSISRNALRGFQYVTDIIIPESVKTIADGALGNPNLSNIIIKSYIPNLQYVFPETNPLNMSVTLDYSGNVPDYAFSGKTNLKTLILGNSITSIGNYSFNGCSSLINITIPASLTSINQFAFNGCSSLTNITIPASVTSIGNYAFNGCTSLTSVSFFGNIPSIGISNFTSTNDTSFYKVDEQTNTNNTTVTNGLTMFTNKTLITVASPTITNFSIPTKTYGDVTFSIVDPSSNSGGVFSYITSDASIATVSGKNITIVGPGSTTITATQNTNYQNGIYYTSGTIATTFIVNKITPQIGEFAIPNKLLSDASFSIIDPTKPNNNTGTWTYESSDLTKATVSGNVVTLLNVGFVSITATLSGNSIYNSITTTRQFLISTITYATPTVITNTIPISIEPVGNTVVLSSSVFTSANRETLNPTVGTHKEKIENRKTLVNTLFTMFSTVNIVNVSSSLFYLPPVIAATLVKVIKTTGTTAEIPLLINASELNKTTALFCPIDEVGNSVMLNGINLNNGYSMKVTKESDDYYTITKTDSDGISTIRTAVQDDIIYYAGFKIVIGSITAQLSDAPTNMICFKEGCQILTIKGYRPVEKLIKGDLIKTVDHGFLPIDMIGKKKMIHNVSNKRIKDQLYRCSSSEYPEVFGELVITGCHSILVEDFFSDVQREKTMEYNKGRIFITDNHYRLPAFLDNRASVYEHAGTYTIYHFALENEDYYMNYGVYANGLLVETCSKRYLKEIANMKMIE
jgi:hypothetical protein